MRFARVPLTTHEKTGKICQILDENLKPTKVRSLELYKLYGIPDSFIEKCIDKLRKRLQEKQRKETEIQKDFKQTIVRNGNNKGYSNEIRPCFKKRMDKGEMMHDQRLAWLSEIYYAGYNTPQKMLELCRETWNDFNEKISIQQIMDYFNHERYNYHPYKCKTIISKGWCIQEKCSIWTANY